MKYCFLFFRWPNQRPHFTDYDEPQSCPEEIQVRQTFQKSNIKDLGVPILSFSCYVFFLFGSFVWFFVKFEFRYCSNYLLRQGPQINFLGQQTLEKEYLSNCFDLLWEKIARSDRKYLLKFEAEWKNDILWIHQL